MSPIIYGISDLTEVQLGMPAVLACLATGFPVPSISWRKDGEEVNIYDNITQNSMLEIIEFASDYMTLNSSDGSNVSGYTGSGSVLGLLMMHTNFTVDQVLQLGGLAL